MRFSISQIEDLVSIIQKYQTIFIGNHVGWNHLSSADKQFLSLKGLASTNFSNKFSKIEQSFYFGMLSQALGNKETKKFKYEDFVSYFEEGKHLNFSEVEVNAIEHLKSRAYNDISGLGQRIKTNFSHILLTSNQTNASKIKKLIKEKSIETIKNNTGQNWLASQLRNSTKDWARDFDRISDYLMHEAFDNGRAAEILKTYGSDAWVYKDVYDGACEHCIKLYLTNGIGSEPILFKLNDLIANGNNIGRKVKDWLPVIGALHPFCRCTLSFRPPNTKWNPSTKSYSILIRNKSGIKRTSKVKITLNGKDI